MITPELGQVEISKDYKTNAPPPHPPTEAPTHRPSNALLARRQELQSKALSLVHVLARYVLMSSV